MHANNGSMREEDREKEISSMFSGVTLAPNIQKYASHRIDNSANVPLAPPRVTSSMLASANPTPNPTSATKESRQKTVRKDKIETTNGISFQNEEGKHNDPTETIASIPDIEELQVHGDELPITPQMTQELYDCMHPILPTIQELVSQYQACLLRNRVPQNNLTVYCYIPSTP